MKQIYYAIQNIIRGKDSTLPAVLIGTLASKYVGELWVSTNFKDILFISPLIYIGVSIVAMAFILGTVIVKSWRVANENPVVSIKSE